MGRSAAPGLLALALGLGCGSEVAPPSPAPPELGRCARSTGCTLYLEAEAFAGAWSRQQNLRPFHGWGFAVSNAGAPPLEARIRVPPGRYRLFGHAYVDGQDRSWRVEVEEGTGTVHALEPAFGPAGDTPHGVRWAPLGAVSVVGGELRLRIHDAGDGFETPDLVVFTADPDYDPAEAERGWRGHAPGVALRATLDDLTARANRAAARAPGPMAPVDWLSRRDRLRARVAAALGVDVEAPRTPLLAEVHGVVPREGYRIERLSFESRPGMVVTAHVMVPDGPGPFPAVAIPIGHYWDHGKADHRASAIAHGLARQGVLTLIYDAFGQGERDIPGNGHSVHWGLVLTGRSNLTFMVWDTIRALDYLETRPDVDPLRLGVTGGSGGGLNALYTAALDVRVQVAAPAIYPMDLAAQIASEIEHDPCALLPNLLGFTNTDEVAALVAPRRQRWLAGRDDPYFPFAGTEAAATRAAARYEALGAGGAFDLVTFAGGHQYALTLRQALYGAVRQTFEDPELEEPLEEPTLDLPAVDDPDLPVFERRFVPPETETAKAIARAWTERALDELPGPDAVALDDLQTELRSLLGARRPSPAATLTSLGPLPSGRGLVGLRLDRPDGPRLWGQLLRPADAGPDAPVVVLVDGGGLVSPAGLEAVAETGAIGLRVSTRGLGDGVDQEWVLAGNHLMLGEPLLGLRATDLAAFAGAVRADPELGGRSVHLVALGDFGGWVGLVAQGLLAPFDRAVVSTPATLLDVHRRESPRMVSVPGLALAADAPHLVALAARRPLVWATPAEILAERHPDWASALTPVVVDAEALDVRAALDALRAP